MQQLGQIVGHMGGRTLRLAPACTRADAQRQYTERTEDARRRRTRLLAEARAVYEQAEREALDTYQQEITEAKQERDSAFANLSA